MILVDTHCHLDFVDYNGIRAEVIRRAVGSGVTRMINPGTDLAHSQAALDLAAAYPGTIYAAVGIHPGSTAQLSESWLGELRLLAARPGVVAVGEIGLDYYRDRAPRAVQRRAFETQLALAAELGLPVIVHNREADPDMLAILSSWTAALPPALSDRPGVLHSFSAPQATADRALQIGFYLGFTGPVTFKKADELRRVAAGVPEHRILIETDGPFLTPHPHRGQKPNEPAYVRLIAERLAALRAVPDDIFAAQTTANAERLFALPPIKADPVQIKRSL